MPASPARAASIVAFNASKLVWLAISAISRTTVLIRSAAVASDRIVSRAALPFDAASCDTVLACSTCDDTPWIEAASCSLAAATIWTFRNA